MTKSQPNTGKDMRRYCAKLGTDPLLVQGAGGNASWKEGSILWVKASGTWLADAEEEEIFIPVDLVAMTSELAEINYAVLPKVLSDTKAKPSIETLLHALMPHPVVLHLHAIEALAHLVREDFYEVLEKKLSRFVSFVVVEYRKPGADLASAVGTVLTQNPSTDVVFLRNHGIMIGGENTDDIHQKLCTVIQSLFTDPMYQDAAPFYTPKPPTKLIGEYALLSDSGVQQLALNPALYKRVCTDWALYPDHIVFLGPRAHAYESWSVFDEENLCSRSLPELIFLKGEGVFIKPSFTKAKKAQLRCYFDVLARQKPDSSLVVLTDNQIAELLTWDAEQYRLNLDTANIMPGSNSAPTQ